MKRPGKQRRPQGMNSPGKQKAPLGWLYVVSHENAPDLVKIGETDRPVERMRELDNPTILARVPVMRARDKEQLLHRRFESQRLPQSEYFRLNQQQLNSVLHSCSEWRKEVEQLVVERCATETRNPSWYQSDQRAVNGTYRMVMRKSSRN